MELKSILEALLFSSQKPLSPAELRQTLKTTEGNEDEARETQAFRKVKLDEVNAALEEIAQDYQQLERSYQLVCVAGSWQFATRSEYAPWLRTLLGHKPRPTKLSLPALETLAIVAYRQPLTRSEIEQVRGVSVDGVMQTLAERGLVRPLGRADVIGRPMTYGTTPAFLEYFGLGSLDDLPAADELRRIVVEKPEGPVTAEADLATATDEASNDPDETVSPSPELPLTSASNLESSAEETEPETSPSDQESEIAATPNPEISHSAEPEKPSS